MIPDRPTVAHPDWLIEAAKSARELFRLVEKGKIPEPILGWMVVTKCLYVLRCVYGSDLNTVAALRERVLAKELDKMQHERTFGTGE